MPRKKKQRPVDATDNVTTTENNTSKQRADVDDAPTEPSSQRSSRIAKPAASSQQSAVDDVRVGFDDVVDHSSSQQQRHQRMRQHNVSGSEPFDANRNDTQDGSSQRPRARRTHRAGDSTELTSSARRKERRRRQREEQRKAEHEAEMNAARDDANGKGCMRHAVKDGVADANGAAQATDDSKQKRHVVQDRHHYEHRVERRESLSVKMDDNLRKALQDVEEVDVNGCQMSVGHLYNIEMMVNGDPNDLATALRVRELMDKIDGGDLTSLPPDDLTDAVELTKSVHMTNMNVIMMRTAMLPVGDNSLMKRNFISLPEKVAPSQPFLLTFLGFDGVLYENVSTVVSASELEMSVETYDKVDEIIEKYQENEQRISKSEDQLIEALAVVKKLGDMIEGRRIYQTLYLSQLADIVGVSPMPSCNRAFYMVVNHFLDKAIAENAQKQAKEEIARNEARRESGGRGRRTRRHTTKADRSVIAAKLMCMSTGDSSGEMSCNMSVTLNRGGIVNGKPASDQTIRGFCVIRLDGIDRNPKAYASAAQRLIRGDTSFITVISGNGDAFTGAGDDDNNGEGEQKDFLSRFVDAVIGNEIKRRGGK